MGTEHVEDIHVTTCSDQHDCTNKYTIGQGTRIDKHVRTSSRSAIYQNLQLSIVSQFPAELPFENS